MMNQSTHGNAGNVTAAGRDHIETHDTHHHHYPNNNRQNEFPLGDVEIRRLGLRVSGLNATFAIAGTVYLGSIALNGVLSLVQAYCEQVLFKIDHGSYIIHVITKDAQSKQELLEQVTSKALEKKLEDIFDKKVEGFLLQHPDFSKFSETLQSHPGWNFWSRSIIVMMVKQTGKYVFKLVHYYLKRLLLMTRNCDFEIRRLIRYDCAIRNLLEVAERLVEVSHNRFVRMLVEILEIVHSGVNLRNVPDNYYPTFILQTLLHSFNTIHEIFESRKKSQCDSTSSSIFVLLFTIYKLLLLYNDRSARPPPVTELSSCVLRLCYYHPPHNGKLPHELSVAEIFDSGSNLLKQGTEKNKAAKKFRNYRIDLSESDDSEFDESDEFEYDEFHDISDSSTSFDSAFPRRNVDQHLPSLDIAVSSGYGVQKSTGLPVHESGHYKWSSGYGSEQGTVSLLPPPSSLPTQKIKSSFPKRFGAQHQQFP